MSESFFRHQNRNSWPNPFQYHKKEEGRSWASRVCWVCCRWHRLNLKSHTVFQGWSVSMCCMCKCPHTSMCTCSISFSVFQTGDLAHLSTGDSNQWVKKRISHQCNSCPHCMAASQWKWGRSQVERKLKVERSIYEWVYVASSCFCCCQLESTPHSTGSLNDLLCVLWHWYLLNSLWNTYSSLNHRCRIFPTPTQLQRDETMMKH